MPIGKSYLTKSVRSEILKVLESKMDDDLKKREIGNLLFKLAQKHGNEVSNQIVEDFNLSSLKIKTVKD